MAHKHVLVTGGSGFIAGWCIASLLDAGYTVRTTVRSEGGRAQLLAALAGHARAAEGLDFVLADLDRDDGWARAVEGCHAILHVAMPMGGAEPANPDALVLSAVDGVRRVFSAAVDHGVARIVMTSSVAAHRPDPEAGASVSDETVWTDLTNPVFDAYIRSKTMAEKLAWHMAAEARGQLDLITISPTLVVGPLLGHKMPGSVAALSTLLNGPDPRLLKLGYNFVDVRDVADLHVRALESGIAGERFIAGGHFAWLSDIQRLLRAEYSVADDGVAVVVDPRRRRDYSAEKAARMLGWRARPLGETIRDCARSLAANDLLPIAGRQRTLANSSENG